MQTSVLLFVDGLVVGLIKEVVLGFRVAFELVVGFSVVVFVGGWVAIALGAGKLKLPRLLMDSAEGSDLKRKY